MSPAGTGAPHPSYFQSHTLADLRGGRRAPGAPAWSPDGQEIAFYWAREEGGRQLWTWAPDSRTLRQLTRPPFRAAAFQRTVIDRTWADRPRWSPAGDRLCCGGQLADEPRTSLWLVSRSGQASRLTQDPGSHRNPAWSPDGRQIAFVSYREGKDELWLVSSDGGPALQLIWDRYHNSDPRWSPDGRSLAFTTQRSDLDPLVTQVARLDMGTGAVEVLTEGGRIHSRYPRWAPDGRALYFLSDRSGYDEVWHLDLLTGRQHPVTPPGVQDKEGEFTLAPDGRRLAYRQARRACQDLEVLAFGGAPRRLNTFDGTCVWPDWAPDGRRVAFQAEAPNRPPEIRVVDADTGQELAHTACSPAPEATVPVEMVSFPTFDGRQLDGVLFGDPAAGPGRPAILGIHGGPNAQESFNYDPYLQALARDGYLILLPNSRGSTGYGRAFMDLNLKDWGGQDVRDWLAAVEWLTGPGRADPRRVALWGRSYGGYATLVGLEKAPATFACGVCHFGPTDLVAFFQQTAVRHLMMHFYGLPWRNLDRYRAHSPLTHAEKIAVPLLVLQGDRDESVPAVESERMVARLRELGKDVEYVCYPGEAHGFDLPAHVDDAARRIRAFFGRHLLKA